uniref:Uncharacterized protein n=1 Tax=Solanum lycopersicum TaxID=4081 RepID=A0A3Q7HPG1_SOLLC
MQLRSNGPMDQSKILSNSQNLSSLLRYNFPFPAVKNPSYCERGRRFHLHSHGRC